MDCNSNGPPSGEAISSPQTPLAPLPALPADLFTLFASALAGAGQLRTLLNLSLSCRSARALLSPQLIRAAERRVRVLVSCGPGSMIPLAAFARDGADGWLERHLEGLIPRQRTGMLEDNGVQCGGRKYVLVWGTVKGAVGVGEGTWVRASEDGNRLVVEVQRAYPSTGERSPGAAYLRLS